MSSRPDPERLLVESVRMRARADVLEARAEALRKAARHAWHLANVADGSTVSYTRISAAASVSPSLVTKEIRRAKAEIASGDAPASLKPE